MDKQRLEQIKEEVEHLRENLRNQKRQIYTTKDMLEVVNYALDLNRALEIVAGWLFTHMADASTEESIESLIESAMNQVKLERVNRG